QSLLLWQNPEANGVLGSPTTYKGPNAVAYMDPASPTKQATQRVQIGLCTKCHTPHQAKSQTLLWNHTLSNVSYKWDDPNTTAGTPYSTFKGDTYKGPTTKCLSCHDGLLASTDGMWFNRQFVSGSAYVAPSWALDSGHEVAHGANISKTHPVAMPYPLNGASNTYNFVANGGNIEPTEWVADPMSTNKIRLFRDDGSGNIIAGVLPGRTGIECTSCHDVHNGARVKDIMLLTGKLTGSDTAPGGYICTQCHKK
ncbi:MAG TPA: cytochrome c3 family protein, partial [Casimicrobiaceae bacterium]|nr:cytochrome c3 family protein [Casimicrobiaceae bacterium]